MTLVNARIPKKVTYTRISIVPPIPLVKAHKKSLNKDEFITLKLRTTPNQTTSPTYDQNIPLFNTGTPDEVITAVKNIGDAISGTNITSTPGKYNMACRIFTGYAKQIFETKDAELGNRDDANFQLCLQAVVTAICPPKMLQKQHLWMRRELKQPHDMSAREFSTHVVTMNNKLEKVPPLFNDTQKLGEDELILNSFYALHPETHNHMLLHGFDPAVNTMPDLINMASQFEETQPPGWRQKTNCTKITILSLKDSVKRNFCFTLP